MAKVTGCWAACLDDCDGGLSYEHVLPVATWQIADPDANRKAKLSHELRVAITGDEDRLVALEDFKAQILCRRHNTKLKECDEELGRFSRAIRGMYDRRYGTRPVPDRIYDRRFRGHFIERALLKLTINAAVALKKVRRPLGGADALPGFPVDQLVHHAFGRMAIRPPMGMWLVTAVGEQIRPRQNYEILFRSTRRDFVDCCLVTFWNWRFAINLISEPLPQLIEAEQPIVEFMRPFINFLDDATNTTIRLEWPEAKQVAVGGSLVRA